MVELQEVQVPPFPIQRFEPLLRPEQYRALRQAVEESLQALGSTTIWNVNSTARGGGVAEMLHSLIGYVRGTGLDARWLVIPGSPDFFRVTKRIHNHLHGAPGDGGHLDEEARRVYEETLRATGEALLGRVKRGDVVLLHDPQTAGLVPHAREAGTQVIWRCHVGVDRPDALVHEAWRFLLPYVTQADAYVFSRSAFVWEGLERTRTYVIPPSIDAFSPKNLELEPREVGAILGASGVLADGSSGAASFPRREGSRGEIRSRAAMSETAPTPPGARIVCQVSRWDALKDPVGVVRGFAEHVVDGSDAHLIVAGPVVNSVADDPESAAVLGSVQEAWEGLPSGRRDRVHLACLPMADSEENAIIVNALQRRSDVVVQKSLAEGFGLTVAEAMWKARPVVASRIGGIQDQVVDGETGLLLDDPRDLAAYGSAVRRLLAEPELAGRMGAAAKERVRDDFLGPRHLIQYASLASRLVGKRP